MTFKVLLVLIRSVFAEINAGKQVLRSGISFTSAWLQSVFCAFIFQLGVSLGTLGAIPAAALDPNITALGEIPQPPIMGNVDPSKIDEIRRTVYVGNLNSQVAFFVSVLWKY